MAAKPTIKDVARLAGVSISTVSYAMNGTRPISEKTREVVSRAMEELGYRPHAMARLLASNHTKILALLFSPLERGLGLTELEFVTCAADTARDLGYHLVLWSTEIHDEEDIQRLSSQGLVDGAILMEVQENDPRIAFLQDLDLPFAMIGRTTAGEGLLSVDIDFIRTLSDAVDYLHGLGHRRIAFLNQSRDVYDSGYGPAVRGLAGFEAAVKRLGATGYPLFAHATPTDGAEAVDDLLSAHPDVTAIIMMNDRAISGVVHALTARSLSVPDDVSLMSVVSSRRVAEMFVPALTSMDVPSEELGRLSVEYLVSTLENKPANGGDLVPCTLTIRRSTGPAPAS